MALVFHAGFEVANLFEWPQVVGSPQVQSTIKKTGNYAMRCHPTGATAYVDSTELAYRVTFQLYIATAPSSDCGIFGLAAAGHLRLTTDRYIDVYYGATKYADGSIQLALNTFNRISVSCGPAEARTYINGVQDCSGAISMILSCFLGVLHAVTTDLYFDDFVFDNTRTVNDLGDLRVALVSLPNAVGTYSQFDTPTPSAIHYQNVDELPYSDSDYNQHQASSQAHDTYGLQDSSAIGLGANDTILAVRSLHRMKRGSAGSTTHRLMVRDNGQDFFYAPVNLNTSYTWQNRYFSQAPSGPTDWTQARFDAFEAGASHYNTGAQDTYISSLMVTVAYLPYVPVAVKNFYSGGFANAKRLTRMRGW